jgi:lipopolysaccharide transport system permease protein
MLSTAQSNGHPQSLRELLLPWRVVRHFRPYAGLIQQFVKREVLVQYRGSYLGCFWALLRPLAMLTLYTIVFGYIFQSRLGHDATESKLDFTLALFCGLVLFNFFSDSLSRAPLLIVSNQNYVTKVVFPLEILPVSAVGAAFIQLLVSLVPLFAGILWARGGIPLTALYLPVILVPLILLILGVSWFLASLGVFIRDINALVPVGLTILMYASAIFYSLARVPSKVLPWLLLNPLAVIIDQSRNALFWGLAPAWPRYGALLVGSLLVALGGYAFFMRTKRGFADVM